MKRIILQHWDGEPSEVERASWTNIAAYASRIGADYAVLTGKPMGERAFPHMHKLYLFDAVYDDFETVVMMDSDMFARTNAPSIFDAPGIGVCGPLQKTIRKQVRKRRAELFDDKAEADYYGGAVYKFDRAERVRFRTHLTASVIRAFDSYEVGCDEGVVHYLATLTRTSGRGLPNGETWACSSFDPDVASAKLIHIRRRIAAGKEERQPKVQALQGLVKAGVLAL